jgi:hypothetical protein
MAEMACFLNMWRELVLISWSISLINLSTGPRLMRSSVDFWYLLISRRATVPGRYRCGRFAFFSPDSLLTISVDVFFTGMGLVLAILFRLWWCEQCETVYIRMREATLHSKQIKKCLNDIVPVNMDAPTPLFFVKSVLVPIVHFGRRAFYAFFHQVADFPIGFQQHGNGMTPISVDAMD